MSQSRQQGSSSSALQRQRLKKKDDPFAGAKPREEVLKGKGVDVRQYDEELSARAEDAASRVTSRRQRLSTVCHPKPGQRELQLRDLSNRLLKAVENGDTQTIKTILGNLEPEEQRAILTANVNQIPDAEYRTPLMVACSLVNLAAVEALTSFCTEQITVRVNKQHTELHGPEKMTAVHFAAGYFNEYQPGRHKDGIRSGIVKLLLDRCHDKNALMAMQSSNEDTALHIASWQGMPQTHDVLKSEGAPSDLLNRFGEPGSYHLEQDGKMGERGSYNLNAAVTGVHHPSPGLRDGMVIRIYNTSNKKFLLQDLTIQPFDENEGDLRHSWTLQCTEDGLFAIKSSASGCFLGGGKSREGKVSLASAKSDPRRNKFLQWDLEDMGDGKHAIKSLSSGNYLNGGAGSNEAGTRRSNPRGHPGLQWEISEVSR